MNVLEEYQRWRPYLFSIAYRMLGSVAESEDILQDTYLRWRQAAGDQIDNPKAYLSTIVTRLCLDRLGELRHEREAYPGPWLPEPLATPATESRSKRETLTTAFLLLLERLSPVERAVYLLREVFEHSYKDIALIINKKPANCRQILHRAKVHLEEDRRSQEQDEQENRRLLEQLLKFTREGDYNRLREILVEDARLTADGGGKVRGALRHILQGAEPVAKFILGAARKLGPSEGWVEFKDLNGTPAGMGMSPQGIYMVITLQQREGRITDIFITANPDKLRAVQG
jgi:RNA polymerase sigma-70 factor (ECF subfamily)